MTAAATTASFNYEAKVTEISSNLLNGPLRIDDSVTGTYIIDSTKSFVDIQKWGSNGEWSQTFFEGALRSSSAHIGNEFFQFETGFVRTDLNTTGKTEYSTYTRGTASFAATPIIEGLRVNSISIAFSPFDVQYPLDYLPLDLPQFSEKTSCNLFHVLRPSWQ